MTRIFGFKDNRVDVQLYSMRTTENVYWSYRSNSFVLVASEHGQFEFNGQRVNLYCINGIGEIRWDVRPSDVQRALAYVAEGKLDSSWDCAESLAAARHFGLAPED